MRMVIFDSDLESQCCGMHISVNKPATLPVGSAHQGGCFFMDKADCIMGTVPC